MAKRSGSKDVLGAVNQKAGKNVTPKDIRKLAGTVKPETTKNEEDLRKLIQQVGRMANTPVSEATTQEIIKAVSSGGANLANVAQLLKMIGKK